MTRRHDWPERLFAVLDRARDETFDWGRVDCFTLAMDVVEALTGTDPWAHERGRYTTAAGARRRLLANGFEDLPALFATLGAEIAPAFAGRGDLGVVTADDGSDAAVVCDGTVWIGRGEGAGVIRRPRAGVRRAWRIS